MDTAVIIALVTIGIPAVLASVGTLVTTVLSNRRVRQEAMLAATVRKEEREAAERREDLLEERSAARAEALAARSRESLGAISSKLDEVHTLANSSYTAALRAALEAVQAKLVVLMDSLDFKKEHGLEATVEMLADIEATRKKMDELDGAIQVRLKEDLAAKEEKAQMILAGLQHPHPTQAQPLPVADNRTAVATERTAAALEHLVDKK